LKPDSLIMRLFNNQSGEALPEYVVLAASLALLSILPLSLLGGYVEDTLGTSMACELVQLQANPVEYFGETPLEDGGAVEPVCDAAGIEFQS